MGYNKSESNLAYAMVELFDHAIGPISQQQANSIFIISQISGLLFYCKSHKYEKKKVPT